MKLTIQILILLSTCCVVWQTGAQTTNETIAQASSGNLLQDVPRPMDQSSQTSNVAATQLPKKDISEPLPAAALRPQAEATPTKPSCPLPVIAPPADITSLTAKEILAANNQVVCQVASMYQDLGLFITIIVTLLGVFATFFGYFAKKSLSEFIQEWRKKLELIEEAFQGEILKMKDAVQFAEKSAASAKKHSVALSNGQKVLSEALTKIDRLREEIDALRQKESSSFSQIKQTLPELGHFDETTEDEPPPETVSDSEAAAVAAQLAGKITTTGREE